MREVEEQLIGLMKTINRHLDHIAQALEAIEGRMADLSEALSQPADEDDAAN